MVVPWTLKSSFTFGVTVCEVYVFSPGPPMPPWYPTPTQLSPHAAHQAAGPDLISLAFLVGLLLPLLGLSPALPAAKI